MGKQKKKLRFNAGITRPSPRHRVVNVKPDDLARYVRQAESQAIPIIKEMEVSAGAALFLLAQYTHALITANSHITLESATTITDNVLAIWQTGSYHPSEHYPFTLEETLQDLEGGPSAKADYSQYFQPFTPSKTSIPLGIGRVAGGIVQHPKTLLWQVWMMMEEPCVFLGAYRDPARAQKSLERVIDVARYGDASAAKYGDVAIEAQHLYHELISQGDGEPVQIPYDMMAYLLENIHIYTIEL